MWRDTAWPDKRLHFYGFGLRIGNGWLGYLRHEWETKPDKETETSPTKEVK